MEIERKFLTKHIPFDITAYPCLAISQAYISFSPTIRIRQSNEDYILTVKGKGHLEREEFELPLSKEDYDRLLQKTEGTPVIKKRYLVPLAEGLTAEVDIYEGELIGLMTTEVEFPSLEAAESFVAPQWFGKDVSKEKAYKNTSLSLYGKPKEPLD
ncbi:MAG: CYTH domain-containing protein [Bacteroidales bacterium]|nr:CYTH domain-containing protein [Anaerotignum sp.]MCI5679266.1 CYTH domain-containing protein [Bacteroidales bacterium]MDY3926158.1 CYTH domain-containing protein [Anaerotignum sp.]